MEDDYISVPVELVERILYDLQNECEKIAQKELNDLMVLYRIKVHGV